jgi:hypothetical protein
VDTTIIKTAIEHSSSFTPTEFTAWVTAIISAITALFGIYVKYIKDDKKRQSEKLINQNVFSNLIKYRKLVLYNFQIKDVVKGEVYRDLLIKKLDIWTKLLTDLAKHIDSKCTNCNTNNGCNGAITIAELKRLHTETLITGIDQYNNYFNSADYTEDEKNLCRYAVEKFNLMHADKVAMVESVIDMLDDSFKFTQCPKTLTDMVFNTYTVAFVMAFKDMNKVINNSNGYFEGKQFRRRGYKVSEVSFID